MLSLIIIVSLRLTDVKCFSYHSPWGVVAFFGSLFIAIRSLVITHLGTPEKRLNIRTEYGQFPSGRYLLRFPVDLGQLLRFVDSKRENNEGELTLVQVALKACALAISEVPQMNGYVIRGDFYKSKSTGVDVSLSTNISDTETILMKIEDADKKTISVISSEVQMRAMKARVGKRSDSISSKSALLAMLPVKLRKLVEYMLLYCGNYLGVEIPSLGIAGFPLGVCAVVSSPNKSGEDDVEFSILPDPDLCSTPYCLTISGIRILTKLDAERRLIGNPVMNCAMSFNTQACTMLEARNLTRRIQQLMSNPSLLEPVEED